MASISILGIPSRCRFSQLIVFSVGGKCGSPINFGYLARISCTWCQGPENYCHCRRQQLFFPGRKYKPVQTDNQTGCTCCDNEVCNHRP